MWTMGAAPLDEYCGSVFWVSSIAWLNVSKGRHKGNGFIMTYVDTFYTVKMKNPESLVKLLTHTHTYHQYFLRVNSLKCY